MRQGRGDLASRLRGEIRRSENGSSVHRIVDDSNARASSPRRHAERPIHDGLMNTLHYWKLRHPPFAPPMADEGYEGFFAGLPQRRATAEFARLFRSNLRSAILIAEFGCGTSSLLRWLSGTSGIENVAVEAVLTSGPAASPTVAMTRLAAQLGFDPLASDPAAAVDAALDAASRNQIRPLWLIDRADVPTAHVASQLLVRHRQLRTVVAVSPGFASRIANSLPADTLRIVLEPFSLADTVAFVGHGLARAAGQPDLFQSSALEGLHAASRGHVASVADLAQRALELAAAAGSRQVTLQDIAAAKLRHARAA